MKLKEGSENRRGEGCGGGSKSGKAKLLVSFTQQINKVNPDNNII